MNVSIDDGKKFYELYVPLLSFTNQQLKISQTRFTDCLEYFRAPLECRVAIRNALFNHRDLIDDFVTDNPANLTKEDLETVVSWHFAIFGEFFVFRYLKKYTVFLTTKHSPNKAYGVLGLADPLDQVIGPSLPRLVTTVLLPFRGKIIYDGLISEASISFGGGVKRILNDGYKQAKDAFGIVTSLDDELRNRSNDWILPTGE